MPAISSVFSQTTYNSTADQIDGKKAKIIVPSSHGDMEGIVKVALGIMAAILIGSILFWAFGASFEIAALEIIGKVFFGLTISAIAIALLVIGFLAYQSSRGGSSSVNFSASF